MVPTRKKKIIAKESAKRGSNNIGLMRVIRCVIYSDVLKNFDSVVMTTKFTRVLIFVPIVSIQR